MVNLFRIPAKSGKGEASEEALIHAARRRDRQAFDQLVDKYQVELRRFLRRRIPEGDLDDVLQETWLAAWTALPSFDKRSRFKTWLYALSLNKCRDHHRALKKVEAPKDPSLLTLASNEDLQKEAEYRDVASGMLAALSPAQREVLELYYFAELTLPEIARMLNRNLNTVKYQFYRAHVQASAYLHESADIKSEERQGAPKCV
jgi:RNA polymerase sigma-70 factor, ECF subfamily